MNGALSLSAALAALWRSVIGAAGSPLVVLAP